MADCPLYRVQTILPGEPHTGETFAVSQAGKVQISTIGNAVIRCFRMRDLIELVLTRYPVDQWIFFQDEQPAELPFGKNATREYVDEAGREDIAIWAVVDPEQICDRSKR